MYMTSNFDAQEWSNIIMWIVIQIISHIKINICLLHIYIYVYIYLIYLYIYIYILYIHIVFYIYKKRKGQDKKVSLGSTIALLLKYFRFSCCFLLTFLLFLHFPSSGLLTYFFYNLLITWAIGVTINVNIFTRLLFIYN